MSLEYKSDSESDDPVIRIDEQGVMIKLSGDKEVARRQWEKARKLINMHLEIDVDVDEEPESQPKTKSKSESKSKSKKPWSDEEERIIADNLDKKPAQLDELLSKEGYERTRGAIHQKKKELQEQQKDEDEAEEPFTQVFSKSGTDNVGDDDDNKDEYSDESFPDTLIQYLWNHTDWKHYKNRDDRIRAIQKILRDRYGVTVSEERIVETVGLDHEDR